jgi:hypothetical protein
MYGGVGNYKTCELAPGLYGKRKFINTIQELNSNDFDRFCRTYLHLYEFYSLYKNAWFTDNSDLIEQNPHSFWKPKKIDFDNPVTFI